MEFTVVADGAGMLPEPERKELADFQRSAARLQRAFNGALGAANELATRLEQDKQALDQAPAADSKTRESVRSLTKQTQELLRALRGDVLLRERNENVPPAIADRVAAVVDATRFLIARPTGTQREAYRVASTDLAREVAKLRKLIDVDVKELEKALDAAGAPWTPGRLPAWTDK
jgi:flagellar biosynthesis/type III secretory pathway chaperone